MKLEFRESSNFLKGLLIIFFLNKHLYLKEQNSLRLHAISTLDNLKLYYSSKLSIPCHGLSCHSFNTVEDVSIVETIM